MFLTLPLFEDYLPIEVADPKPVRQPNPSLPGPFPADLASYDKIIFFFSGGKDSVACILHALEQGIPVSKMEIWHHCVDGSPYEEESSLMDWPCTTSYCSAFANAFGIPIYFSWKEGGFEREMLREQQRTAPLWFEVPEIEQPDGIHHVGGVGGKLNTRRQFPQVSADLSVRWCSSYTKIHVAQAALRNQARFEQSRTLLVSGERAQESPNRSYYASYEKDDTDARLSTRLSRHVDRWRAVLHWSEQQVWDIIERWRINPHPAYWLNWNRCSCMNCIFNRPNQWATLATIAPTYLQPVGAYEQEFGKTINRTLSIAEQVAKGIPFDAAPEAVEIALSKVYTQPLILPVGIPWKLPPGAFGENAGPV